MRTPALLLLVTAACGGPAPPIRQAGGERLVQLGDGIEFTLDPAVQSRHVTIADAAGRRTVSFHEPVAPERYAAIEIERRDIAPALAGRIRRDPQLLHRELHLVSDPVEEVAVAAGRIWVSGRGMPESEVHVDQPDGSRPIVQLPPRYVWTAILLHRRSILLTTWTVPVPAPIAEPDIARRGAELYRARLEASMSRFRLAH